MAHAAGILGELDAAARHARRAASLDPKNAEALATLARLALAREGQAAAEDAAIFAELATDIAPEATNALLAKTSVEERRDAFGAATALPRRVI
ncbi:MAG: hypothetical protein AB7N76_25445 [Planctomycetota bacterium]